MAMRFRVDSSIVFVLLIFLVLGSTALFIYFQVRSDEISSRVDADRQFTFMLSAGDPDEVPLFTQAVIYEPGTARAAMFDVPSNVGAILRSLGRTDRIGELYREEGIGRYRELVSELLGIEIPFHLHFEREQLSSFVDLVDGVDLLVADPITSTDLSVDLVADLATDATQGDEDAESLRRNALLPAGNVTLEGPKVLQFLDRSVPGERNIEPVRRRQQFAETLLERMHSRADVLQEGPGLQRTSELVTTNLDNRSLSSLIAEIGRLDTARIARQRVTGAYRTVEVEGESRRLLFPHLEGQWLRETVSQVSASLSAEDMDEFEDGEIVTIEVLNGTNISGLAERTSQMYDELGMFDVVRYANADSTDYENTEVIDRRGDGRFASRVAEVIRAQNVVNRPDEATDGEIDVTLILGRDFDGRFVRE